MLNELLNGRLRLLEFASSFQKLILLVREAVVLFKRLLVDMLVLLEGFIDLLESGGNLWKRTLACFIIATRAILGGRASCTYHLAVHPFVFIKGLLRQDTKISNLLRAFRGLSG